MMIMMIVVIIMMVIMVMTYCFQMVISQTREKQAGSLNEITWKGKSVPVKNELVRSFILHSHESTQEVERAENYESKMAVYDQLLMECKDGLQSLKDDMKPDQVRFVLLKMCCSYCKQC